MQLSVIIPTWRRPDPLVRCLRGLERQERTPDEVVVVAREDDAETAAALARVDSALTIRVAATSAPGVVAAVNTGLDSATGDLVVLTDDDTIARPGWLARIERHFEAEPRLGGLGGRDWITVGGVVADGREDAVGTIHWFGRVVGNHHLGCGPPREVDILKGANMAYRAAALDGIRMDPALRGAGAEHHCDMDLSMAVKAAGWRLIYDPDVELDHFEAPRHVGQREDRMTPRERQDASHNMMLVLLKHLGGLRRLAAVAYALAVGDARQPGPVLALERLIRERRPREVTALTAAATRGRLAAFRTLRSQRTAPDRTP